MVGQPVHWNFAGKGVEEELQIEPYSFYVCSRRITTATRWVTPRTLRRFYGKMRPRLTGYLYPADRATCLGFLSHLSCRHDQTKMRDYIERRVTY